MFFIVVSRMAITLFCLSNNSYQTIALTIALMLCGGNKKPARLVDGRVLSGLKMA